MEACLEAPLLEGMKYEDLKPLEHAAHTLALHNALLPDWIFKSNSTLPYYQILGLSRASDGEFSGIEAVGCGPSQLHAYCGAMVDAIENMKDENQPKRKPE